MAMRLYSRREFKKALRDNGLRRTEYRSKEYVLWEAENGLLVPVDESLDQYSDARLDEILKQVDRLYYED